MPNALKVRTKFKQNNKQFKKKRASSNVLLSISKNTSNLKLRQNML